MRKRDENKVKAIREAVINLCAADGFTNLTTAKVAKLAGVSPATIYLNYQDKTDMLSRLYEEVKDDLHKGLAGAIAAAGDDLEAQLRATLRFSITQAQEHPKESHFVSALWTNQELLDDAARAYGQTAAGPLLQLYQRIAAAPDFVDAPEVTVASLATVPVLILQTANAAVDDPTLNQAIDMIVKALKK
ncbi:TetR/AcrR family transcriptional regulator [Lacticaseibacillus songhuajiangensis]|jgi:AcrR family transcriptional regulator|uniref:TetR/AcrR family transcriptional regulator n=1 Tax=Lacticaseibacillus songhuajiangensis TaxID=1296539 RepID=UPI000F7A9B06|nr:TetR/AcrR family transcriptional regulator [Lacticaseibacillus songhuajiangensis]